MTFVVIGTLSHINEYPHPMFELCRKVNQPADEILIHIRKAQIRLLTIYMP